MTNLDYLIVENTKLHYKLTKREMMSVSMKIFLRVGFDVS